MVHACKCCWVYWHLLEFLLGCRPASTATVSRAQNSCRCVTRLRVFSCGMVMYCCFWLLLTRKIAFPFLLYVSNGGSSPLPHALRPVCVWHLTVWSADGGCSATERTAPPSTSLARKVRLPVPRHVHLPIPLMIACLCHSLCTCATPSMPVELRPATWQDSPQHHKNPPVTHVL